MKYKEYSNQLSAYNKAMSTKKSLLMTLRMNELHNLGKLAGSRKQEKRQKKIDNAKNELSVLVIPPKPIQPLGYEVIDDTDDCFVGFWAVDDIDLVKEEAFEILGHSNITLNRKPRFRD